MPVVGDLSGAAFVDSSILGAVLDARRQAHERGLGFAVALSDGAQPVQRVLEVTGMTAVFPIDSSPGETLATELVGPRTPSWPA